MENPIAIANYFICKSLDSGEQLTSMKLIKLVYISHGWYLALTGEPLLPEPIEAWKYGPVVKSIYQAVSRKYGSGPITAAFANKDGKYPLPESQKIREFLDRIWELYGKYDGLQLSALTHQQGSPWYTRWFAEGGKDEISATISNNLIKDYYTQKKATANAGHPTP